MTAFTPTERFWTDWKSLLMASSPSAFLLALTPLSLPHDVAAVCQEISADIDKLDPLTDGFVHYQIVRFCQGTRLQYLNAHILPAGPSRYQNH